MNQQTNIDALIQRVGELPPMPQVAQKALAAMRNPDTSMAYLGNLLSVDEAMASLVLRWANSAYYGLKYPVSTVQGAVMYLGQRVLHSLILAASLASTLDKPAPGYNLERGDLWRHSIGVAAGARLVAQKFGNQVAEEAYHAGLLCDIGKLAFEILLRDVDLSAPELQKMSFADLEMALFGIDHAALGAEMAHRWNLPQPLTSSIAYHHRPSLAPGNHVLVDSVHIADAAMMMLGIGIGKDGLQYPLDPASVQRMGWADAQFNDLIDRVIPFIEEADKFIRLRKPER
jgi:putative nucleotidyltransferase with HDIG domain